LLGRDALFGHDADTLGQADDGCTRPMRDAFGAPEVVEVRVVDDDPVRPSRLNRGTVIMAQFYGH
jgi:hypothetical protein